ncbi:MAG: tetratricopeptide repeat protein [Deltaproteobacteria bacterium]|nr:tetratricopeptide repeat protein [Deltaproteobacteria bacterium]
MHRKYLLVGLLAAAIILAVSAYFLTLRPLQAPEPVRAANPQEFIQKRGEEGLKKKRAMALAAVYERMLARYPDNLELKRKLAAAYTEAGQPEKAGPLLDEIVKSEQKNR